MRKYLLLAGAALIGLGGSAYAAIDCAVPPTCEELGFAYSSAKCDGQSTLKCPFDQTKVFCGEPAALVVTCTVGAILYDDLKCYDEAPEGKTAVAIVFDTSKKLAIALDQQSNIQWGGYGTDISGLYNCTGTNYATCGTAGKDNTQKIVSALGQSLSYAAPSCYLKSSYSGGLPLGSWFLPSAMELTTLWDNKDAVNTSLKTIGGTTISTSGYYWSSTELSSSSVLGMILANGLVRGISKLISSSDGYARCAVAY